MRSEKLAVLIADGEFGVEMIARLQRRGQRIAGADAGRCSAPSCRGELDAKSEGQLSAGALSRDDLDSLIAALEQRYGADLRRQLRKFIGSRGSGTAGFDADDAVQEMWVRAGHDLAGGNRRYLKDIRSWLVRIAKNCAIDHIRRRRSEMAALRGFFRIADHTFPDPAEAASDREQSERLHRALDQLNDLERGIVTAKYAEGLSSSEIAAGLGIPASTVRRKQQRALARVKALFGRGDDAVG